MNLKKIYVFLLILAFLICIGSVVASEDVDGGAISAMDNSSVKIASNQLMGDSIGETNEDESAGSVDDSILDDGDNIDSNYPQKESILSSDEDSDSQVLEESDEITVNDWNDLQHYCSLNDKNYVLKLKENTNYYPDDPGDSSYQIIVNNNVTIIGSSGAYIGDASPNAGVIKYIAIKVNDDTKIGINMENVTFKWIRNSLQPDGVFLQMGGNAYNSFKNCYVTQVTTSGGHSCILYIKRGDALVENCTFINCTTDFGVLSIYYPKDDPSSVCTNARMQVNNCYFEGNYAKTEPGCINNCGVLLVNNSTFYRNSAFWWAGAIHTHGGANTTIYDSNFTDNLAGWNGGALYTYSYLQIYNTIFEGNNCTTNNGGGAIGACKYLHAPFIYVDNCTFIKNENLCWSLTELSTTGTGRGGAISLMDEGGIEVYNSTFISNSAAIGSAICAIAQGTYGSPYIKIVGNSFINHTRIGDVLILRVDGTELVVDNNYYYNNSIPFTKLRLVVDKEVGNEVFLTVQSTIENPGYYESDILDTTEYAIYVDDVFVKKVVGPKFSVTIEKGKESSIYVVPCISNSQTNTVIAGKERKYIYVSQKLGDDGNDGLTRSTPVLTLSKAIELARDYENIMLMDGTFSENNLTINYTLSIFGENNAKISSTGNVFIVDSPELTLKNLIFSNSHRTDSTVASNTETLISFNNATGLMYIDNCSFISNEYKSIVISKNFLEIKNSMFKSNKGICVQTSMLEMDNSSFIQNTASNAAMIYGTSAKEWSIKNSLFNDNYDLSFGIIRYAAASNTQSLNIESCSFIHNVMKGGKASQYSSCIYLEKTGKLSVKSSIFKENVNYNDDDNMIYLAIKQTSISITDSIFLRNSNANLYDAIFGGNKRLAETSITLSNNWFGHTSENYTQKPVFFYSINCESILFLNISSDSDNLGRDETGIATVGFDSVDKNNIVSSYDMTKFPNLELILSSNKCTLSTNHVLLTDSKVPVEFSINSIGNASIKAIYESIQTSVIIHCVKVVPNIEINVEDVQYGEDVTISFNWPNDLSTIDLTAYGSKIPVFDLFLKINNVSYDLNYTITLSNLSVGEYLVELTYTGSDKYLASNFTKKFNVIKVDPQISIEVSDNYYGEETNIVVNVNSDVIGEISIDVGGIARTGTIQNGKAVFLLNDLNAGNYTVIAVYGGSSNYAQNQSEETFSIRKYDSTTTLSCDVVERDNKAILNIEVSPNDATGSVTIKINHNGEIEEQIVNLVSAKAIYTINDVAKGDYNIEISYSGNEKYLASGATSRFEIDKVTPSFNVYVDNIKYGQEAIVKVTLNDDAGGNITVVVGNDEFTSKVKNGAAEIPISGLTTGSKTLKVMYSGDYNYANASKSVRVEINKADSPMVVDVKDIKLGQTQNIEIYMPKGASGFIKLTYGGVIRQIRINPNLGLASIQLDNLKIDNYSVNLEYMGDSNYVANSTNVNFTVTNWAIPQWINDGFGLNNTGKSPYGTDVNGEILWVAKTNGTVVGNIVIDFEGNIYVATTSGVYSVDNGGTFRWNYVSTYENNFPAIAISHDLIIAPSPGDSLYFINQFTGEKFGQSNIMQASSLFAPIVDSNANVFIVSEYQYGTGSYNLVMVPYNLWEYGGNPTLISLGKSKPVAAPTFINERLAVVACEDGLKIISILSKEVVASIPGMIIDGRPVIGQGDLIYAIMDDSIVAFETSGDQIWKTKVTGGAGNVLVLDNQQALYSINSKGSLYKYDLMSGEEALLAELNFTSGILIDDDGVLYIGSDEMLYALDSEGNVLWKTDVGGKITSSPVMDKNGIVYVANENSILALTKGSLKDSGLNIELSDGKYLENQTITLTLNNQTTGNATITISGNDYSKTISQEIINGKVIVVLSDLKVGSYSVSASYNGDGRFKHDSSASTFEIGKGQINVSTFAEDIQKGQVAIIKVNLVPDATGIVILTVGEDSYNKTIENGEVVFNVPDLAYGKQDYFVEYSGNELYLPVSASGSFNVNLLESPLTVNVGNPDYGENAVVKITLPEDAGGIINVTVDGKISYIVNVNDSEVNVAIPNLSAGNHTVFISYSGDEKFESNSTSKIITVNKAETPIDIIIGDVAVGDIAEIRVYLASDVTGKITVKVIDEYENTISNGSANIKVSDLSVGTHTAIVTYSGDGNYNSKTAQKSFKVTLSKSVIVAHDITCYSESKIVATLTDLSGILIVNKTVSITVDGNVYSLVSDENGNIETDMIKFDVGRYDAYIRFAGDEEFEYSDVNITVTVLKSVSASDMTRGYNSGVDFKATFIGKDGNPLNNTFVQINVGSKNYSVKTDNNGVAILNKKLGVGRYTVTAINPLTGDKITNNIIIVKRITGNLNIKMNYLANSDYKVRIVGDDGKFVGAGELVTFNIAGKIIKVKTDKNGFASVKINLAPKTSKYKISAEYKGFKTSNNVKVNSILSAKNIKIKKSAKKSIIKVTLKKVNGKYLKSKKITLKFNKKTYKAKTNKKGVAKFKIPKKAIKKLKVGKKYKYQVTYLKDKTKKTIQIKK